jgi:hypothetical protein
MGDGKTVQFKGLKWCRNEIIEIGVGSATANILCESHNSRLGEADSEAKRLKDFLEGCLAARDALVRGERRFVSTTVSGHRLSRWLSKTHCDLMTMESRSISADYVRLAYGRPTCRPIRVVCLLPRERGLQLDASHIAYGQFTSPDDSFFWCDFYGVQWLVAGFGIDGAAIRALQQAEVRLYSPCRPHERIRSVAFGAARNGGRLTADLRFDWQSS